MFGGTRRFLALVSLCALCGCTGTTDPTPRAQPPDPTTTTTSTTSTTTTSTTTPEPDTDTIEFQPLPADPTLTVEQQIEAAYLHSWDIYLHAINTWDTTHLDLIYDGGALDLVRNEVERLRSEGRRVVGHVDHDYAITVVDDDTAVVMDGYRNYLVATVDGDVPSEGSGALRLYQYDLARSEDRWMLVGVGEHSLAE